MPTQEPFRMPRMTLARLTMFILCLAAIGCDRRPPFNIDGAQMDLAQAFERQMRQIAIYSDGRGAAPDEWLVDFRIDGVAEAMQARFKGVKSSWQLQEVRIAPATSNDETPWESVGVILGRMRGDAHERATDTMARMRQLADLIGGYAVRNGNRFPAGDMSGLERLLIMDGQILEKDWRHSVDGWGQQLLYHAAPDGNGYVLVSPGADGQLDQPQSTYFQNAEQGLEAYGGRSSNPDADIVIASGGFVQSYEP